MRPTKPRTVDLHWHYYLDELGRPLRITAGAKRPHLTKGRFSVWAFTSDEWSRALSLEISGTRLQDFTYIGKVLRRYNRGHW